MSGNFTCSWIWKTELSKSKKVITEAIYINVKFQVRELYHSILVWSPMDLNNFYCLKPVQPSGMLWAFCILWSCQRSGALMELNWIPNFSEMCKMFVWDWQSLSSPTLKSWLLSVHVEQESSELSCWTHTYSSKQIQTQPKILGQCELCKLSSDFYFAKCLHIKTFKYQWVRTQL